MKGPIFKFNSSYGSFTRNGNRGVARGSWGAHDPPTLGRPSFEQTTYNIQVAKTPWQYLGRKSHCWKAHFLKKIFFVKYFRQRLLSLVNMGLHAAIIRLSSRIHEGEQWYKPYIVGDPQMVSLLWPPPPPFEKSWLRPWTSLTWGWQYINTVVTSHMTTHLVFPDICWGFYTQRSQIFNLLEESSSVVGRFHVKRWMFKVILWQWKQKISINSSSQEFFIITLSPWS